MKKGIMTEAAACCGLSCHSCPIYVATRQENESVRAGMRAETFDRTEPTAKTRLNAIRSRII